MSPVDQFYHDLPKLQEDFNKKVRKSTRFYFTKITDDSALDDVFAGGGTVSAWIYANGIGAGGYGRIFDKDKAVLYVYSHSSGQVKLNYTFAHDTTNATGSTTSRVINYGKWHHVAILLLQLLQYM